MFESVLSTYQYCIDTQPKAAPLFGNVGLDGGVEEEGRRLWRLFQLAHQGSDGLPFKHQCYIIK